jgi:CBS domain-containing protein
MKIRDLMTKRAETCNPKTDLAAAAMIMWREDCGIVPVVDDDLRVLGVLTDRDICIAVASRHQKPEELHAGHVMSKCVFTVGEDDEAQAGLETMRREAVRRLPVVDRGGRLAGIVSINDYVLHARNGGVKAGIDAGAIMEALKGICAHKQPEETAPQKVLELAR